MKAIVTSSSYSTHILKHREVLPQRALYPLQKLLANERMRHLPENIAACPKYAGRWRMSASIKHEAENWPRTSAFNKQLLPVSIAQMQWLICKHKTRNLFKKTRKLCTHKRPCDIQRPLKYVRYFQYERQIQEGIVNPVVSSVIFHLDSGA